MIKEERTASAWAGKKLRTAATARTLSVFRMVILIGVAYYILYPLIYELSLTFMSSEDLYDSTVNLLPYHLTTENLQRVFRNMQYPVAFVNTAILAIVITAIQMLVCSMVGYGFARFAFPGKQLLFALVIATLIVPTSVTIIPMYLQMRFFDIFGLKQLLTGSAWNLIGSPLSLVLMALTGMGFKSGLYIFIARQFFRNLPKELEEACMVDGAGYLRTFFSIMLPNARAILVVIGLFSMVWQWNDLFYANWFLPNVRLLPTMLMNLAQSVRMEMVASTVATLDARYVMQLNAAGILLTLLPVLLLFIVMQKQFVQGIERSGIVG